MSLKAYERETVINMNDEDDVAYIVTYQRPWITKLKRNPAFKVKNEGSIDGSAFIEDTLPTALVGFRQPRKEMSDERRAELSARMRRTAQERKGKSE